MNTRYAARVQYTPPMAAESKKAVVAAIIGNLAIAVIKFVAGAITGSSAMISEGIHSVVDTGNGGCSTTASTGAPDPPTSTTRSGTAWRSTSGASSSP